MERYRNGVADHPDKNPDIGTAGIHAPGGQSHERLDADTSRYHPELYVASRLAAVDIPVPAGSHQLQSESHTKL